MNFDFYSGLDRESRSRYDLMLATSYVLLRCDEWRFVETDENGKDTVSVSWLQSIQPTLELFGLDAKSYPQGSISANRHYYEAIRTYVGGSFPKTAEFMLLRQGLRNFLSLRRDDSSPGRSYLFGSCFMVTQSAGTREPRKYRSVMVSLRHTATALSILCEECADALSPSVEESIAAFFTRIEGYLSRNDDWKRDGYRHLTLGSVLKTCSQVAEKTDLQSLRERARSVAEAARNRLFSDECLHRDVSGECTWILPDPAQSSMARFQYYLDAFVLAQVPELMADARCQSIVRGMIENRIECRDGKGVPLRPLCNYGGEHPAPDFGASVSVAYLLFRCIESRLGDERWIEFCQEHFQAALDFCLRTYDKSTYYLLPHSENHSKALLLPACGARAQLPEFIVDLKEALNREMEDPKGKLRDLLRNVDTPPGLEHVKDLLLGWETSKYWKHQRSWTFDGWSQFGELMGGLSVGVLKALSSAG